MDNTDNNKGPALLDGVKVSITHDHRLCVDLPGGSCNLSIREGLLLAALLGRSVEKVLDLTKAAKSNTEAPSPLRSDA